MELRRTDTSLVHSSVDVFVYAGLSLYFPKDAD